MSLEQELWASAMRIEREHGANANRFIVERIEALARAGDEAGIERWLAIADKLDQLRDRGTAN